MAVDVMQTELGGVAGLVFPFWELPVTEGNSFGFRIDAFECGYEIVAAALYASEADNCPAGVRTAMPTYQLGVV
jgi:hypothetical protein